MSRSTALSLPRPTTLLEEGFCILGARSLFNQERFFGPSFSNFSNKGDYDLRMRGTSWDGRCLVAVSADSIVRREPESCTRGSATVGFSGVPLSSKLAKRSRSHWAPVCVPTATPVVHLSMSCSSVLLSCFFLVEGEFAAYCGFPGVVGVFEARPFCRGLRVFLARGFSGSAVKFLTRFSEFRSVL